MPSEVEQMKSLLQCSGRLDGKGFSEAESNLLSKYYELVLKWNKRLHLTTLTEPQQFFEKHILESAFAASLIVPSVIQVWDLGSGLGVPGMLIAILRPDLTAHLVEASLNKTLFLEEAVILLRLKNVDVIKSRFEEIEIPPAESCLTVRAIEGMEKLIPEILRIGSQAAQIMLLGAKNLETLARGQLNNRRRIESILVPGSYQRYIVNIVRST
jgi:16S rRNA (guanine527-N7)-methyltransferase